MNAASRALAAAAGVGAVALALLLPATTAAQPRPTPGPQPTSARPTPDRNQSLCAGYVTSTVSADTIQVCDTLTTTVRLVPECPFCLGGISIVFVQPERALANDWMRGMSEQMLDELDRYRQQYERDHDRVLLVQGGVLQYDEEDTRTLQAMTSNFNQVRSALRDVEPDLQDGGPYDVAARDAVQLFRSATRTAESREQGGVEPCLEIVVMYGSSEGATIDMEYRRRIDFARNTLLGRTKAFFAGCSAIDPGCGFWYYIRPELRFSATRFHSVTKFRDAMLPFLREIEGDEPDELVRDVSLTQRLPVGLSYILGSASPPPAAVISTGEGTVLRWDWIPLRKLEPKTVSYGVRPNREGSESIEGGFDLRDVNGLQRVVPMASRPITVSGLCITPSPTPTDTVTPMATRTPVNTVTPTPSRTPTSTSTPSATPTYTPSPTPKPPPLYLPLALREVCEPKQRRLDVALVIDTSTSMGEATPSGRSKLAAAQAAAHAFLGELQFAAGDQAALVTFNQGAALAQPLTTDRAALDAAIAAMALAQQTCIVCGVELADAELHGARRNGEHAAVMIVLTDGRSNPRPVEEAIARAAVAKAAGVMLFTIGVGDDLDVEALAEIASRPDFFFRTANADDLERIYREIAVAIPCAPGSFWGRR